MENVQVQHVSIDVLKPHPRNNEFFDDISGTEYEDFKEKIKNEGIMTPLLVTPDFTIISGHQRTRAAKDLGIKLVPVIIMADLIDDDVILRKLIASNSGRLKNNEEKARKAIAEYVELCGYGHGGSRNSTSLGENLKLSQKEIAAQLGISVANLNRVLSIERNLTDNMKEMLDTGTIGKNLAADCIASLSPEEQKKLIEDLGLIPHEKASTSEIKDYIAKCKRLEDDNKDLKKRLEEKPEPEIVIKEVKSIPKDYENLKLKAADSEKYKKSSNAYKRDYENEQQKVANKNKEVLELKEKIQDLQKKIDDLQFGNAGGKCADNARAESIFLCAGIANFIRDYGGCVWVIDYFDCLSDKEKDNLIKGLDNLAAFCQVTINNIENVKGNMING